MSSPARHQAAGALASQPVFPDEILEEIFVRLDAVEDLARRRLHDLPPRRLRAPLPSLLQVPPPPPVLGVFDFDAPGVFHPAEPPHRSTVAAHALAQAVDFTFSFLGTPHLWKDLSFRMICTVQCEHKIVTFNLSSVTGQWRGITFNRTVPLDSAFLLYSELLERHYAHGCCFLTNPVICNMVILNMHDMKLSSVYLPPGKYRPQQRAIVEAGEGMIGLFSLIDDMLQLYYRSLRG